MEIVKELVEIWLNEVCDTIYSNLPTHLESPSPSPLLILPKWSSVKIEEVEDVEDKDVKMYFPSPSSSEASTSLLRSQLWYVRIANSWVGIKPTASLSAFDKKNSIEFLLNLLHYIYNYYYGYALYLL